MSEKNLPLKLVLSRKNDIQKNSANGGGPKFFGKVTPEMQKELTKQLQTLKEYYEDIFSQNTLIPVVAKIIMKDDAVSKSNKPNRFCKNIPIIGTDKLNEIYVKVTKDGLEKTMEEIQTLPAKDFRANMTAIKEINPIPPNEKLINTLEEDIPASVKVTNFNFKEEFSNLQATKYFEEKMSQLNLEYEYKDYTKNVKFYDIKIKSKQDIEKISNIEVVKSVDYFQRYSMSLGETTNIGAQFELGDIDFQDAEEIIGIIDSGIEDIELLAPYIVAREEYIPAEYQNRSHGTFVASMVQYGDTLNEIERESNIRFKFVDIVAIPNADEKHGPVDSIGETDLMDIIIDVMDRYSGKVKLWNLSLGSNNLCGNGISTLGAFFDDIQDKYGVQFIVAAGNIDELPLRDWPPQDDLGEHDRITTPADSVRSITVGAVARFESKDSIVKIDQPSPFSRRGPGANFIVKPDVVDYGGNYDTEYKVNGLGVRGLDRNGQITEGNGTSYSAPRVSRKIAELKNALNDDDMLLSKALLVHSAKLNSGKINSKKDNQLVKYYGFGRPYCGPEEILQCSQNEITLIFKQEVLQGSFLELNPFPFPESMIIDGKYYGEVFMTLAYNPKLDSDFGQEYSRVNLNASFGRQKHNDDGSIGYSTDVPIEANWDQRYERELVENGFKWSPLKSYYKKMSGIDVRDDWKIRIDMVQRNEENIPSQEFVLLVTLKTKNSEIDLYSDVVLSLRNHGYHTQDLDTRYQERIRQ